MPNLRDLASLDNVPKFILQIRKDLKLSQCDLAKACGVTHSFISHLETGRRLPSMDVLRRILKFAKKASAKAK